jgi:hypothetical protein
LAALPLVAMPKTTQLFDNQLTSSLIEKAAQETPSENVVNV